MPDSDETRQTLARIEGMLQATLPQHAARLDSHDQEFAAVKRTQVEHGERLSSIQGVIDDRSRRPNWTAILSSIAAAVAVIVAVVATVATYTHH